MITCRKKTSQNFWIRVCPLKIYPIELLKRSLLIFDYINKPIDNIIVTNKKDKKIVKGPELHEHRTF